MEQEKVKPYILALCELIPIVNAFLVASGKNPLPFSRQEGYIIFSILFGGVAFLYACWKNHNITPAARAAQAYLNDIKNYDMGKEDLPANHWEGGDKDADC